MLKKIIPLLLLLSLLLIFFFDVIFLGKTLSTSSLLPGTSIDGPYGFSGYKPDMPFSIDIGGNAWINEPNPYIIKRTLNKGILPLWNPYEGLGMPLVGNLNTEIFNPLKIFLNLSPSPFLQDIFFLLRLFVMGIFTYLFLRELRRSYVSSLFGSSFFMLSGYSLWWINLHPLSSIMYIPAFFYFMERWKNRNDRWSPCFLAFFIAMSIFGGKIPDVLMGLSLLMLYSVLRGFAEGRLRGLILWGVRIVAVSVTGVLLASVVVIPFLELHNISSPLAKALRTGAFSHSLPLITSISLWQPLFLGSKNYFYASWLQWEPHIMLFYSGVTVLLLFLYACMNLRLIKETFPFVIFSILLFSQIYGLLPTGIIAELPVFRSMNFLKYNSMLYFSLAVISATALDNIIREKKWWLVIVLLLTMGLVFLYHHFLTDMAGEDAKPHLDSVLFFTLPGMFVFGILYYLFRNSRIVGAIFIVAMLFELFLYMPEDRPDRDFPYREPPYMGVIKEKQPYRIIGDGESIPPLVSNAFGLYDIRGVNVLIPHDYYIFFEHLLSFSVPYTNAPDPLVSATSPWADLLGVKYILSHKPLEPERLEDALNFHVKSLRWIRLFDAMLKHSIEGWATYGFSEIGNEGRFSFSFPADFKLKTRLRVTEPFIFAGFAVKDIPKGTGTRVSMAIEDKRVTELVIREDDGWRDRWVDVSPYMGRVVNLIIEGEGSDGGRVFLGNFGPSLGQEEETVLYERLLMLHKRELDFLEYRGEFEDMHVYENKNVMDRAFILHKTRQVNSLDEVIRELQAGLSFREIGLVSEMSDWSGGGFSRERVVIEKYTPREIVIDVESKGELLVLSDLYYPGWKVKVNGKKEEIVKVFGILRGVALHEGKSEVVFYYSPLSIYAGAIISITVFVLCVGFLYHTRRRDKT